LKKWTIVVPLPESEDAEAAFSRKGFSKSADEDAVESRRMAQRVEWQPDLSLCACMQLKNIFKNRQGKINSIPF
jgi:hypothetical protein